METERLLIRNFRVDGKPIWHDAYQYAILAEEWNKTGGIVEMSEIQDNDFPMGLSKPALRALANAGITRLEQISKFSEKELLQLHGLGPKTIKQLRLALELKGLSFTDK